MTPEVRDLTRACGPVGVQVPQDLVHFYKLLIFCKLKGSGDLRSPCLTEGSRISCTHSPACTHEDEISFMIYWQKKCTNNIYTRILATTLVLNFKCKFLLQTNITQFMSMLKMMHVSQFICL